MEVKNFLDKHEVVLQEFGRARLNEEAVSVERVYFYKTDRGVNPKQEDPFLYFPGEISVLVSAPHAVRHYRKKKIKMSDEFTGSVAFLLNKITGCHVLTVSKLYGGDPNEDNPCIYKDRITALCSKEKIKVVLDIHGAARERKFDVEFGTNGGKTLLGKAKIQEVLDRHFQLFGLGRISHDPSAAAGPNSVANFAARELGIPAVQIEVNKLFRVPAQNPQGFHRMLGALTESIKELGLRI